MTTDNPKNKSQETKTYIFFAEAWIALLLSRVILVCIPFKKIASHLENKIVEASGTKSKQITCEYTRLAIKRACKYAPWRTMCFEQAIAAKIMLNRRNIKSKVYFGVYKNEITHATEAHAWLKCGTSIITGENNLEKLKIINIL